MKIIVTVIILATLPLLFTTSCMCDKEHTYNLTQTSRQYFADFEKGSYWVYENYDDSTDIDTLSLINKAAGLSFEYTESTCDGDYHEYVTYQLKSAKTGDTLRAGVGTNPNIDNYGIQGKYHNLRLNCSFFLNKSNEVFQVNTYMNDRLEYYNSYNIKNKTYTNVIRMTSTQFTYSPSGKASSYCYGQNQGLIEFVVPDQSGIEKRFWLKNSFIVK